MTRKERLAKVLLDVKADIETIDGMPFTGTSVGAIFGQQMAMIYTLTHALIEQELELERLHERIDRL